MAKKNNTADIGFEKEIWKAADLLRGNLDASEYKSVVLGLIFLKYISDRFEAKYNELVEEGDGFEEDKDEYTSENIFFVPQEARWAVVVWGIERSGFFNGREKWAKGFENQRV